MSKKKDISYETVWRLSQIEGLTDKESSAKVGLKTSTYSYIRRYRYNIDTVRPSRGSLPRKGNVLTEEVLKKLYYDDGLSQNEIAQTFGINRSVVRYAMKKRFDMKPRTKGKSWKRKLENLRKKGKRHPTWKGGRWKTRHGYIRVENPDVGGSYIFEHRLVWEEANGPIPEGCHIHHINGIRDDNRLENLAVIAPKNHGGWTLTKLLQKRIRELEADIQRINGEYK